MIAGRDGRVALLPWFAATVNQWQQGEEGFESMIDWGERKRYWRDTKWQMVATLAPFLVGVLALPIYAEALNGRPVFGMPLGYFVLCHGLLFIAAIVMAGFVNRQDAIDRWHGANEDP